MPTLAKFAQVLLDRAYLRLVRPVVIFFRAWFDAMIVISFPVLFHVVLLGMIVTAMLPALLGSRAQSAEQSEEIGRLMQGQHDHEQAIRELTNRSMRSESDFQTLKLTVLAVRSDTDEIKHEIERYDNAIRYLLYAALAKFLHFLWVAIKKSGALKAEG